ncbi:hypothetical protein MD484_g1783, partial [Candolleomyces efflorescens]
MATAVLQGAKVSGPSLLTVSSKPRRPNDSPEASSSRYPQPTIVEDVFGSPSTPEQPSRSFHRFRSSLEQSLRTATRSKKLPAPPVDEFATITGNKKKGKEKETHSTEDPAAPKEKDRLKMFRKVTFRKGDREVPAPLPSRDESSREKDRVAGHTSFMTPSLRLASMSSPALHLSSQALPSPKSQPAVTASSSSNYDALISPTRPRTRRTIKLYPYCYSTITVVSLIEHAPYLCISRVANPLKTSRSAAHYSRPNKRKVSNHSSCIKPTNSNGGTFSEHQQSPCRYALEGNRLSIYIPSSSVIESITNATPSIC